MKTSYTTLGKLLNLSGLIPLKNSGDNSGMVSACKVILRVKSRTGWLYLHRMHLCYPWEDVGERKVPLADGDSPKCWFEGPRTELGVQQGQGQRPGDAALQSPNPGSGHGAVPCYMQREGFGRQSEESAHGHDNPTFLLK